MNCNTTNAYLFDSKIPTERAAAKFLCRSCPAREACLTDALSLLGTVNPPRSIYAGAEPRDLWRLKNPALRDAHFRGLDAMPEPQELTPEDHRELLETLVTWWARRRERRLDRIFSELMSA